MTEFVLMVPGHEPLALTQDALRAAQSRARELLGVPAGGVSAAPAAEPWIGPDGLAAHLGVPVSWIEQAARDGRIPCYHLGRYVRFRRAEVEDALEKARTSLPKRRVTK